MKIFKNKKTLQKKILKLKNLSFVPTMGSLHKGHEKLIKIAKKRFKKVIVSIYINPKQFNSREDFRSYPRNVQKDINILKRLKVDYLYMPNYIDIFHFKPKNKIFLHNFKKKLCGKTRKGHFKGVLNVINRFLDIIKPKYILLGKKDFQQLFLVKKHIERNKIPTRIIPCETVRNKNGIAFSSRNNNLKKEELRRLAKIINKIRKNKKFMNKQKIIKILNELAVKKIDYVEFLNLNNLKTPINKKTKFNIFIAFYIGKTRLIDNF
tara:strand:- start:359 stop:1153 length:795 start_codon:yes stop_codon:yes gene_type:complete